MAYDKDVLMKRILLLSGMDGMGILFRPLLKKLNAHHIAVYDLNDDDNQMLDYQSDKIVQFIHQNFNYQPFILVAESYSSLFIPYLLKYQLNIQKIYIIGGFLAYPSWIVKFAYLCNPLWINYLPDRLLGFLLFRHLATDELIGLFREVLAVIGKPNVLPLFKQRLSNIAHATMPTIHHKSKIPCVYLSASHDDLVSKKAGWLFGALFDDIAFYTIDGTHFLLQTNPAYLAEELNRH